MGRYALFAAVLTAFAVAASASAASIDIEKVVVSRSTSDAIVFRIAFAGPVTLEETTVQVALDTDQDRTTGTGGVDYALDWSGSPSLLEVVGKESTDFVETRPPSLRFRHEGAVAIFSIAATDLKSPTRFDFYVFVEQAGTVVDVLALDESLSGPPETFWPYPLYPDFTAGDRYPSQEYPDVDNAATEWDLALLALGVFVLAALATVIGIRGRRHTPRHPPSSAWGAVPFSRRDPVGVDLGTQVAKRGQERSEVLHVAHLGRAPVEGPDPRHLRAGEPDEGRARIPRRQGSRRGRARGLDVPRG